MNEHSGGRGEGMGEKNFWLVASVVLLFVTLWIVVPGTHLVMDEGYRLLQAFSLSRNISFPVMIDYPGARELGEIAGDVRPMPEHYGSFTEGGLKSFYSPALALLASFFTGKGMLLVPLFSGFLLWLLMWRTLKRAGFSRVTAAVIPLFCTPLVFYSLRFWSYPLSILLVYSAVNIASRGKALAAYLLVALAALFRIEFLIAVIPVFFRLPGAWHKKLLPGIPAVLVVLAGNWIFSGGSILGTHIGSSTSELSLYSNENLSLLQQKLTAYGVALLSMVPGRTGLLWLLPGGFLWALWGFSLRGGKAGTIAAVAGLTISLTACVLWAAGEFRFLDGFSMKHPLMVFTILWLFTKDTFKKSIPELAMLVISLIMLLPMHTQGPDWGVRHLFLPLFLMVRNMKNEWKAIRLNYVLLFGSLITSSALLFLGINRGRVETLSNMAGSRAVITTNWIIPGWFTDNMMEGSPVVYTRTAAHLAESLFRLRAVQSESGPAIVCLYRDAAVTVAMLDELGYRYTVGGEVSFGSSLRCLMLIPEL